MNDPLGIGTPAGNKDPLSIGVGTANADPLGFGAPDRAPEQTAQYIQGNFGAGMDMAQAQMYKAGSELLQRFGFSGSEAQTYLEQNAKENLAIAAMTPVEDFWDQVQMAFGQVAVAAPPTLLAGVAGGPAAASYVGSITGAGLSIADAQLKAEELDPDSRLDNSDMLMAAGLGSLDMIPIAKGLRMLGPTADGIKQGLTKTLTEAGGVILSAGATEAVQDAGTSYIAYTGTGTPITEETVSHIADQAALEGLIGSVVSLPFASASATMKQLSTERPEMFSQEVDEDGNTHLTFNIPTTDLAKNPGLFKRGLARTLGRSTDPLSLTLEPFRKFRDWKSGLTVNQSERKVNVAEGRSSVTQDVTTQLIYADMVKSAKNLQKVKGEVGTQALALKSKGEKVAPNEEVQAVLDDMYALEETTRKIAGELGYDKHFNWRGEDYVPLLNVDFNSIIKDEQKFIQEGYADIESWTKKDEETDADFIKRQEQSKAHLHSYVKNVRENGRFTYGVHSSTLGPNRLLKKIHMVHELQGQPEKQAKVMNSLKNQVRQATKSNVKKSNPLEQERFLTDMSESFWNNWRTDDVAGNYQAYMMSTAQRLAVMKHWGPELEKYWLQVGEIIQEAQENGVTITERNMQDFIHISNLMQGLPTSKVSANNRILMDRIRSFENINKLGLSLFPSIPEALFVFNKYGVVSSFSGLGKVALGKSKQAVKGLTKDGDAYLTQDMLDDLGMSMHEATNIMVNRLADETFNPSMLEQKFFNLTGLPQFTEGLRMVGAIQAEKAILKSIKDMSSSNKAKQRRALEQLYEAGLNPQEAKAWFEGENGNTTHSYYQNTIRPATIQLAEDVVVNPNALKKPIWHSNEHLKLVSQLKSFATVFTNGVMRNWYDKSTQGSSMDRIQAAGHIVPLVGVFLAMQWYMAGLREYLKTGDTERWDEATFYDGMLMSMNYLGGFGLGLDSLHAREYGNTAVGAVLGPAAATVNRTVGYFNQLTEDPEGAMAGILTVLTPNAPGAGILDEMIKDAF